MRGGMREDSGTVNAPIGRHPTDRKKMAVTQKGSRSAVTHWEVIARYRGYTHIRCRLETGRTHQIRVHMAHIGHPLLGDALYGAPSPDKGLSGQCLHAREPEIHPSAHRRKMSSSPPTCPSISPPSSTAFFRRRIDAVTNTVIAGARFGILAKNRDCYATR